MNHKAPADVTFLPKVSSMTVGGRGRQGSEKEFLPALLPAP